MAPMHPQAGLGALAAATLLATSALAAHGPPEQAGGAAAGPVLEAMAEVPLAIAGPAQEPHLDTGPDGAVVASWLERDGAGFALRGAVLPAAGAAPLPAFTVAREAQMMANWADFPSVVWLDGGRLAAHWLIARPGGGYAYDIALALSGDGGASWSAPARPHGDDTDAQHGFVSLVPEPGGGALALWLDGRFYDGEDRTELRAARLGAGGMAGGERVLDTSTCSCCQTAAAVTASGVVAVAYRDRTPGEIRDIALIRRVAGRWQAPRTVHDDGWEIPGCPVNGPALAAAGERLAVAWYTAANDAPAVLLAFSGDAGASFGAPLRIDAGDPLGRVDVLALPDGSALVSWLEWEDGGTEALMLCRAWPGEGCRARQVLTRNDAAQSLNFPRLAASGRDVFVAWTQPGAGGGSTVALVRGRLAEPIAPQP